MRMDDQGGRRSRPAAHAAPAGSTADARQAPWPPAQDPRAAPGQLIGPGTGGYRVLEAGSAPAPPRLLGPGSGPQPTLDRTPVRGFPPPASGYQQRPPRRRACPPWMMTIRCPRRPSRRCGSGSSATAGPQGRRGPPVPGAARPGWRGWPWRSRWSSSGAFAGYKFLYDLEPRAGVRVAPVAQEQDIVILFIPSHDKHEKELNNQDVWAGEAMELFKDLFGGATAFVAFAGIYLTDDGKTLHDKPILIESYVSREALEDKIV